MMAKHNFHILLFIALIILNLNSISATPSPTLPPSNRKVDTIIEEDKEIDAMIEALVYQGGYTIWAKFLADLKTKHVFLTNATLFLPSDAAISRLQLSYDEGTGINPYRLIPYHITPKHHLLFSDLCHLKPLTLLPTLVALKTIVITSTIPSNYMIDNSRITHPNLYTSSRIVVHGSTVFLTCTLNDRLCRHFFGQGMFLKHQVLKQHQVLKEQHR